MVAHSRGEYVLLLNNDAVLRPGSLKAFRDYAATQPIQGILGLPQYTLYDGSLVNRGYEFDLFMNPIPVFAEGPTDVSTVTGACLWIPRKVWDEIGGFPDWFESVAEDIYLCHAARLLGYPVVVLAEPGFDHWIGRNLGGGKVVSEGLVSTTRRRTLSERNKTWVMMICYPLPMLLLILPIHGVLLAIEAIALLATGTRWNKVKSIYLSLPANLCASFARAMEARRHIQRNRKTPFAQYLRRFHSPALETRHATETRNAKIEVNTSRRINSLFFVRPHAVRQSVPDTLSRHQKMFGILFLGKKSMGINNTQSHTKCYVLSSASR